MATYYVDATSGSDSENGTSDSTPWKTIAKVNGATFSAGDSILFKKGETWREQLTVPSSGESGNPITFGAYGTGAKPILSASNLLVNTLAASWQTALSMATTGDASSGARNRRNIIAENTSTYSGTKIRVSMRAAAGGTLTIDGVSIGVSTANDDFDAAPTRVTWDGGSSSTTIAAGTTKVSDAITFTFTKTNRHALHVYLANKIHEENIVSSSQTSYSNTTASDDTTTQTVNYGASGAAWYGGNLLEVYTSTGADWTNTSGTIYSYTLATEPLMVAYNGTILSLNEGNFATLDSGEWDYQAGALYVNVGEDPNTGALEAGQRAAVILLNGKDYLTLDNLAIHGPTNARGIYRSQSGALGIAVSNCDIKSMLASGIQLSSSDENNVTATITDNTFIDAGNYALVILGGAVATGNTLTISRNTFTYSFFDGTGLKGYSDTILRAIHADNISAGTLIISNNTVIGPDGDVMGPYSSTDTIYVKASPGAIISGNYISGGLHGIQLVGSVAGTIVSRNMLLNTGDDSLFTSASSGAGLQILYNVFHGSLDDCLQLDTGMTSVAIYNNIFSSARSMGLMLGTENGAGVTIKNNIFYQNGQPGTPHTGVTPEGVEFRIDNVTGVVIDHNVYYHTTAKETLDPWKWGVGGQYTWADYLAANGGQDTHSLNVDPLFVSTTDFRLQVTSPCINAGVDVGLTTDYAGNVVPKGALPDIGAYEWFVPIVSHDMQVLDNMQH